MSCSGCLRQFGIKISLTIKNNEKINMMPVGFAPRLPGQIYCSCNICIHHFHVAYEEGRAPTGALGDAGAVAEQTAMPYVAPKHRL
jgi:hypothetical protein